MVSTAVAIRSPPALLLLRDLRDQFALLDRGAQIVEYKKFHVLLSLIRRGSNMWEEHNPGVVQEAGFHCWLVLVDIQTR